PFPRGKVGDSLNFSLSGLKTAVIRYLESSKTDTRLADVAASFQEAVVEVLVEHTFRAALQPPDFPPCTKIHQVLLAGGVAANTRLKSAMLERGEKEGIEVIVPPPMLCTDNAAMAAAAGYFRFRRGETAVLDLDCYATDPLGQQIPSS
ncbi:MAG: Kae1-like domain-containing protein, partial [Armatimonadota bacterium]